jgi:hypothetical protein
MFARQLDKWIQGTYAPQLDKWKQGTYAPQLDKWIQGTYALRANIASIGIYLSGSNPVHRTPEPLNESSQYVPRPPA